MSYDAWKTTEPDLRPYEASKGVRYRCLDCAWRGHGVQAFDHHRENHHRIVAANGVEAIFTCCQHESGMTLKAKGAA